MTKRKRYLIPILLIFSFVVLVFSGCNHFHKPENKVKWVIYKLNHELDLNEIQQAKLEDVKNEIMKHRDQHKENREKMLQDLILEIQKPAIDPQYLLSLLQQRVTKLQQVAPTVIDKIVIFHESLTVDQKDKAVNLIDRFKKHHQYHAS